MSKSLDRLGLLSTFVRIAERGSISAAARDLGISQASASRQLAALERLIGMSLVLRTTHSLALTEAGRDCLSEARGLLQAWDALAERAAAEEAALAGRLKVVAPVALGQMHLADAVIAFQAAHPRIEIVWLLQDEAIRFAELGCDLWIRIGPVPDERLAVRPLASVERLVVAAPDLLGRNEATTPADLADLPSIALSPFEGPRLPLQTAEGAQEVLAGKVALSTDNIFVAKKAALQAIGFALLPRWFVAKDLAAGRLLDVLPLWRGTAFTINAAYLPSFRLSRRLRLFLDQLAGALQHMEGLEVP